jgi:hypothetical protein
MSRLASLFHFHINQLPQVQRFTQLLDTTLIRVALVASVIGLSVLYIWLVNSSTSANFQLSDLRKQSVALEDGYQKMQLKQTALRSLSHTQEETKELQLTAAGVSEFVTTDAAVASLIGQ